MAIYKNRIEAGKKLAEHLSEFNRRDNVLVLALASGGLPVAYEVSKALDVPMDVYIVRKLVVPGHKRAIGAIASRGIRIINEAVIKQEGISDMAIATAAAQEQVVLERRERLYHGDRPEADLQSKTVIVVDDGMATGSTMRAAVLALRTQHPDQIVVAVPAASNEALTGLEQVANRVIALQTPASFSSVEKCYDDYRQVTDEDVLNYMKRAL